MGLNLGGIMLEGNRLDDISSILEAYDLSIEDSLTEVDSASSIWEDAGREHYLVALCGPWTVVLDPDTAVLASMEEACAELSRRYNCRLAGFILLDVSASYCFWMFDEGNLTR